MQAQEFHILKEKQQKSLNKVIQTVKNNFFSKEEKEEVVKIGSAIITAINNQRKFIYKELEGFEFNKTYDHAEEKNANVVTNAHSRNLNTLKHELAEELSIIIHENKKGIGNGLTGPNNNKLTVGVDEFNKFNDDMEVNGFRKLIEVILNSKGEKVEEDIIKVLVTQEFFDKNKDFCIEEGKKLGDLVSFNGNDFTDDMRSILKENEVSDKELREKGFWMNSDGKLMTYENTRSSQENPVEDKEPAIDNGGQKYTLVQEDLDNNPDLEKQGLKIGDEIIVPFDDNESTQEEPAVEQPKEPYFPKGGATAIPQEEIQEGNKNEPVSPRKPE